jgi:hypothetical protein
MRKIFVILFCLLVVATLINCGIPNRTKSSYDSSRTTYRIAQASYDIFLISVDRPDEAEKMYGEQRIKTVIEEGISRSYFEDGMVRVEWRPTSDDIGFIIYNKMYDSMKIVWDEARFFDEEGNIHRLIHSGIGYEERKDSHPPTIIAARGNLEDFIHPADYFRREESSGKKSYKQQDYWNRAPFLPTQIKGTAQELRAKAEPIVGKTFQVILPLQIGNVRSDYIYTFKINRVDVTEKEQRIEKNSKEGKGSGRNGRR